jgi:type IV secretory pathway VirB10-like protein
VRPKVIGRVLVGAAVLGGALYWLSSRDASRPTPAPETEEVAAQPPAPEPVAVPAPPAPPPTAETPPAVAPPPRPPAPPPIGPAAGGAHVVPGPAIRQGIGFGSGPMNAFLRLRAKAVGANVPGANSPDPQVSLAAFDRYLAEQPDGPQRQQAMVGRAITLDMMGDHAKAAGAWQSLAEAYPESPDAKLARHRLLSTTRVGRPFPTVPAGPTGPVGATTPAGTPPSDPAQP